MGRNGIAEALGEDLYVWWGANRAKCKNGLPSREQAEKMEGVGLQFRVVELMRRSGRGLDLLKEVIFWSKGTSITEANLTRMKRISLGAKSLVPPWTECEQKRAYLDDRAVACFL